MTDRHLFSRDFTKDPQDGDSVWTLKVPLSTGDTLFLYVGKQGHEAFVRMLRQEHTDDMLEDVLRHIEGRSIDTTD